MHENWAIITCVRGEIVSGTNEAISELDPSHVNF